VLSAIYYNRPRRFWSHGLVLEEQGSGWYAG